MPNLLPQLQSDFPNLNFVAGKSFYWSPKDRVVYYDDSAAGKDADWKLLHETGHGILSHQVYKTDFQLLQLESAAWQTALQIAPTYGVVIGEEHIEDCLDSYRDWLHSRSTCPTCLANGLQTSSTRYECLNCDTTWQVSHSRFCRAYRRSVEAI